MSHQIERRASNRDPDDALSTGILALLVTCGAQINESDRTAMLMTGASKCRTAGARTVGTGTDASLNPRRGLVRGAPATLPQPPASAGGSPNRRQVGSISGRRQHDVEALGASPVVPEPE